jgi:glycerophosphoryl diester phosphodiesterase
MLSVIAHRGSGAGPLENTLRGMRQALAWGVDGVEFDVWASADGEIVVFHDETLERTTNGTGLITTHTLKELRQFDAGEGETIPTLREMLILLKPHEHLLINVEIKPLGIEEPVLQIVQELDMLKQTVISAFSHEVLHRVHALNSDVTCALLYIDEKNPVDVAKELGCKGLHPLFSAVTPDLVVVSREEGLHVIPWTVNFGEEVLRLVGLMVDGIITDVPPLLLELLYPDWSGFNAETA